MAYNQKKPLVDSIVGWGVLFTLAAGVGYSYFFSEPKGDEKVASPQENSESAPSI